MATLLATVSLEGVSGYDGMKLDGGGSVQLYYDGQHLVESVDDRKIPVALAVFSTPKYSSSTFAVSSETTDPIDIEEQKATLSFTTVPESGTLTVLHIPESPTSPDLFLLDAFWQIESSFAAGSFAAEITLGYDDSLLAGTSVAESDLGVFYDSGNGWEEAAASAILAHDIDANTITVATNHFSDWTVGVSVKPAVYSLGETLISTEQNNGSFTEGLTHWEQTDGTFVVATENPWDADGYHVKGTDGNPGTLSQSFDLTAHADQLTTLSCTATGSVQVDVDGAEHYQVRLLATDNTAEIVAEVGTDWLYHPDGYIQVSRSLNLPAETAELTLALSAKRSSGQFSDVDFDNVSLSWSCDEEMPLTLGETLISTEQNNGSFTEGLTHWEQTDGTFVVATENPWDADGYHVKGTDGNPGTLSQSFDLTPMQTS